MSSLSLRRAAALSFLLHMVLLVVAVVITHKAADRNPVIYTVRLVDAKPSPPPRQQNRQNVASKPRNRQEVAPKVKKTIPEPKAVEKPEPPPREDTMALEREKARRLRELKASQVEKQKDRRLREIEDKLKAERLRQVAEARRSRTVETPMSEGQRSRVLDEYTKSIHDRIVDLWVFPDIDLRGLEAVVSITVKRNGTIVINRFERPSGNTVFDQSALKAINKAGRVEPPPFGKDMDIGLVFTPDDG